MNDEPVFPDLRNHPAAALTLSLPWPAAKLSPNGRGHWRTKESAREAAKLIGRVAVKNLNLSDGWPYLNVMARPLFIIVEVYPPDRRRYDWDNLVGRLKYYQDGICEELGINDNQIKRAEVVMKDAGTMPEGAVFVTIRGQE